MSPKAATKGPMFGSPTDNEPLPAKAVCSVCGIVANFDAHGRWPTDELARHLWLGHEVTIR